jgi:1-acyl-sn-glycerol-3-phosphate acyltransferase
VLRAVRQGLRIGVTGAAFLAFFTGGALLGWVGVPVLRLVIRDRRARARRYRRIVRAAWRVFHHGLRWGGLLEYDPRRVRLDLPAGPFVLVANHPTLLDVTAIVSACPDLIIVVKATVYRSVLLGPLLRACDYVEVGGGGVLSSATSVEACVARLSAGLPVLIFPEGTRSPASGLHPFRAGATHIASLAGVPVIPVLIRCDPPTLLRGDAWWEVPPRTPVLSMEQLPRVEAGDPGSISALHALYRERITPAPSVAAAAP